MKKIFDRLKMLRGTDSQSVAAKRIGISQQGWARYETGKVSPGAEVIHHICCAFGVSADWLLGLSDDRAGTSAPATDPAMAEKLAAKDAEIERLKGEIAGLRYALDSIGKRGSRSTTAPATAGAGVA